MYGPHTCMYICVHDDTRRTCCQRERQGVKKSRQTSLGSRGGERIRQPGPENPTHLSAEEKEEGGGETHGLVRFRGEASGKF